MDDDAFRPLVSVVVPVYMRRATLARALHSVLGQSFERIEVIVVDDASPEPVTLEPAIADDPRVRLLRREQNGGPGAARNTGVKAAHGDLVAFLDSDDEWLPEKLSVQVAALGEARFQRSRVRGISCSYVIRGVTEDGTHIDEVRLPAPVLDVRRLTWGCDLSPGSTIVFWRDVFDVIGGFDETFRRLEDWDWLIRYADLFEIAVSDPANVIVHRSSAPSFESVSNACDLLEVRHSKRFRDASLQAMCQFRSSLALERAASAWKNRRAARSILWGVATLLIWPIRRFSFYRNAFERAFGLTSSKHPSAGEERVMHVIASLGAGGAERMLTNVVTAIAARRPEADQTIVELRHDDHYDDHLAESGVARLNCGLRNVLGTPLALYRLARMIRQHRPTTIKGWMYHANLVSLIALWLSGRRRSTRLIWGIRCSNMDVSRYRLQLRIVVFLSRLLSTCPDLLVANSNVGRTSHIATGYPRAGFSVLYNGVNVRTFAPDQALGRRLRETIGLSQDAFVIGVLARNDPMKNYPLLLQAMDRLEGVTCVVIGEGTERLPDKPGLVRLGKRNDVAKLITTLDVLVSCSSFGEGMSNSIGEAMASGIPVIATEVGDARQIVGDCGIVIPPDSLQPLVQAVATMRDDAAMRHEMGTRARERIVERFSLERSVDAFERILWDRRLA